jgi:hypothetical protein
MAENLDHTNNDLLVNLTGVASEQIGRSKTLIEVSGFVLERASDIVGLISDPAERLKVLNAITTLSADILKK